MISTAVILKTDSISQTEDKLLRKWKFVTIAKDCLKDSDFTTNRTRTFFNIDF